MSPLHSLKFTPLHSCCLACSELGKTCLHYLLFFTCLQKKEVVKKPESAKETKKAADATQADQKKSKVKSDTSSDSKTVKAPPEAVSESKKPKTAEQPRELFLGK